jgi:hypothetical protein
VTCLLQLRVFCLGFFQDWGLGVRILPEREEVLICSLCLCCVPLQGIGAPKLQKCESAKGFIQYVENFLEINHLALSRAGICDLTMARMSRFSKTTLWRSCVWRSTTSTIAQPKSSAPMTWFGNSNRNTG